VVDTLLAARAGKAIQGRGRGLYEREFQEGGAIALLVASQNGYSDVAVGADMGITMQNGGTSLFVAGEHEPGHRHLAVVEALLAAGADRDSTQVALRHSALVVANHCRLLAGNGPQYVVANHRNMDHAGGVRSETSSR
jgi:hypothetical protein